ncbi:DUF1493 family protein [Ralstonia pseudosolanacearum]|uniref:DUF1493 family protein n=1 Tax=Ralstonia pseudosolanacearum TaxID=1310165 RepID=UPI0009BD1208|nr:DUF1493 family protein [Ralstonia pseudosolanacearum]MCK4165382.1 DUF1493 family protein [Ralstonia pseudosolanacearum]
MVDAAIWERLSPIARAHTGWYIFRPWKKIPITRDASVSEDLGLEGESAEEFLAELTEEFHGFEFSAGRGDFVFANYFRSEVSQSFSRSLIYLLHPEWKNNDQIDKLPLTLGMLEDAISRGYWETAKYRDHWIQ